MSSPFHRKKQSCKFQINLIFFKRNKTEQECRLKPVLSIWAAGDTCCSLYIKLHILNTLDALATLDTTDLKLFHLSLTGVGSVATFAIPRGAFPPRNKKTYLSLCGLHILSM